jgi:uncharacterized protein
LIIVDTGPLVAAADADDHDHDRCVAMFRAARRPWLVPQPVIAEVCYLLERERGSQVEAAFLRSFGRREMTLAPSRTPTGWPSWSRAIPALVWAGLTRR